MFGCSWCLLLGRLVLVALFGFGGCFNSVVLFIFNVVLFIDLSLRLD